VERFIQRLSIKTAGPDQLIRELSGGNQQKVLLARWLCLNPRLLLLDEPTRGIDVGAKAEIQALIEELAESGLGVLMISSEREELIEGSDRIVVLRDGHTVASLPHADASQDALMAAMAQGNDPGFVETETLQKEAARLAGIPVKRTTIATYVIVAVLAGLAGLIVVALNADADPSTIGLNVELNAIAAVGETFVIMSGSGGIDISLGSVAALSAVVAARRRPRV
jgi:ABC-type methionine transport system ATPase subunit